MSNTHDVELFGTDAGASVYPAKLYRYSAEQEGEYEVVEPQGVQIRYPHCDRVMNWIDAILGNDELECKPAQSLAVQKIIKRHSKALCHSELSHFLTRQAIKAFKNFNSTWYRRRFSKLFRFIQCHFT